MSAEHLAEVFDAIGADPQRFAFFAAVRAVERAAADSPRLGRALNPAQEPLAVAHHASADFPRTTIESFDRRLPAAEAAPRLRSNHFGLTGPMGPMPFYLTELVIFERNRRGPRPLGDFLDLLTSRQLQFFYRAWADSQPCAQADRPADDGFAAHLGAVSGAADLRFVAAADRPAQGSSGFDSWARLGLAGHFAGLRSASAVADVLSWVLATPVRVVEGVGRWRDIPPGTLTRLGGGDNRLGLGATLGRRFFATEWDVRLVLTAADMAGLDALLPGGARHAILAECARAILPQHIEWSARIEIDEARIAPARLQRGAGGARLGQTGWIAPRGRSGRPRDDLRLHSAA
ncbi:type VI secretion system baseplate subunit TssG [Polymorphobacter fuscus]|uniref:Type VI secretion system baseplate subunit TssG n=1 Tax=Sandarakinorhabdus fusca TaxID=1439888 RepID=A0A7C9KXJ4_9SPHN|nr:type VI secretion system baseplate subunit TssG [Polymorphobacter fuscus]KAB7648279.1 type VI secretion system baseplate subunit TssG [Polymorphobacter fuscus]MQT15788.1 type VI secretion system baseplate subunit TssG [Polymorphobacter fuscus]NJC07939.1 type VI secretion system protein ImpH [Polymorphobacter fuscus]